MSEEALPRAARESVFLSAVVTPFGAAPSRHRVRNLSGKGACIDGAASFRKGQTVIISVGKLEEVGATVRWAADGLAGLEFTKPIEIGAAKSRAKPAHVEQGWNGLPWQTPRK